MPGPRIVSLIASATESVAALGLLDQLVGRSHECDYPPEVTRLPACSRPKIDIHKSSYRIDQQIKSLLRDGLSIYEIDVDLLSDLRPDIIVTQTHCEVCAVSERDVRHALSIGIKSQPRLVSLQPDRLVDVWDGIKRIAETCGVAERGNELVRRLKEQMQLISDECHRDSHRPSVGCIEWAEPLMVAGNWTPELVGMANATDPLGQPGRHSPLCSWERLAEADPEVLIIMPCGYELHRARQELLLLQKQSLWNSLRAVTAGKVYFVDGNAYLNRPGPRLVESLKILGEILHPRVCDALHEGDAWLPMR